MIRNRRVLLWSVSTLLTSVTALAESREAIVERVGNDIRYLASEELEGRGVETEGIHRAADFILSEYRKYGLKPGLPNDSFRQSFQVALGKTKVQDQTGVVLRDASGKARSLTLEQEFQPLQRGKNGKASGKLIFVGYGITSDKDNYDEYAGLDVAGNVLVMIRREPRQGEDGEAFQGRETSSHSYIDRKLELAAEHEAAGVIFVNDVFTVSRDGTDELSSPSGFGSTESGIPFVHVRQTVVDDVLKASPLTVQHDGTEKKLSSLKDVSEFIDQTLKPVSQPIPSWSADVNTTFDADSVEAFNLIGVLEGELADEVIVVGAHYDHLGFGGYGSRARDRTGQIHYGADDNATGTAAVLEIVRRMVNGPKPRRTIVFICFSGEERGLLGSKHYVNHPVFPLEQTVAMLNYDMIGTLRNNRVDVNGVGTAAEFQAIAEAADEASPLEIKIIPHPYAGSDHLPFFQKQIPVMFCFTGVTPRYHTPDDRFEAINVPGVVDVIDYTESLLRGIDALPNAPRFQAVSRNRPKKTPYLGVIPNLGTDDDEKGVPVQTVRAGSPARAGGLQVGDVILKAGDTSIERFPDLVRFLQNSKAGENVTLVVQRDSETVQLKIRLGEAR
ncbi:MAG: M20/M25/M40 family metallo-hydrolase [Fuerstiella sp.]